MAKTFLFLLHEQLGWDGQSFKQKTKKRWYFGPNRLEMEMTGNTAFQITLFCSWFITRFYPLFRMLLAHMEKDIAFWYIVVFRAATKYKNLNHIQLWGDYRVNLRSRRSSVPCSAPDRALTRNVRDELLFRSWQIHVDQWLLKRKCHWRGQFGAVSSRSCQWLCWEN